MGKKFEVGGSSYLRWFWPDRFEIEATLYIKDTDAFREFMGDFNKRHPDLRQGAEGGTIENPNPHLNTYLQLLIEEYLGA